MRLTQVIRELGHAAKEDLAHFAEVDGIEEKVLWVRGNFNFLNLIANFAQQYSLRAERMGCARRKAAQSVSDLLLGGQERIEINLAHALHDEG